MKSYRVVYEDGSFQYILADEVEAKAWRNAEGVKSVKAEEPAPLEPPEAA